MTEPYHTDNNVTLHHGDCLAHLRDMPDNSVDSIVTDPPYGLSNTGPDKVADTIVRWASGDREHVPEGRGFMGRTWDAFVPPPAVWDECLRVLKPGGHMAVFAGSRTQDLMGMSIRLAGFELRDSLAWIYGSGFPKSMDVSKAIDKAAGAKREVVGERYTAKGNGGTGNDMLAANSRNPIVDITAPATPEAERWEGWGSSLKPAIEPILLCRKPLDGTVAANVLAHGVGGLNIDACRVGTGEDKTPAPTRRGDSVSWFTTSDSRNLGGNDSVGRFPANVLLDEHAAQEMDKQSGPAGSNSTSPGSRGVGMFGNRTGGATHDTRDSGGASRFFPVFKSEQEPPAAKGRFPANVLLDEHAAKEMDRQSGWQKDGTAVNRNRPESGSPYEASSYEVRKKRGEDKTYGGGGGASRFFPVFKYQAKAPKRERPVIEREDGSKIQHPTVKPLKLMEWITTLITPPGGTVLDPFAGSGTTLEAARDKGFRAVGIEADAEHCELIVARLEKDDGGLFAA